MGVVLITGSAGLIGSEATQFFAAQGFDVVGIDNNMRRAFFGAEASTEWQRQFLIQKLGSRYRHFDLDIRATGTLEALFKKYGNELKLIIHTAAQPSHDWAARDPHTDFSVNADGTLNMLEATRKYAPEAAFIFTSTNKVYGDTPNRLPLIELAKRWEIDPSHPYANGIGEDMSIDQTLHSLFGASKVAADVLVQEYGRYFGMKTACFRGGCLTGPNHSGTQLHGFLAYLMKCAATGMPYKVFGYQGKQVRDNIHSADLIAAFAEFFQAPRSGEVYNLGGGRFSNCSMLEAIEMCEEITGQPMPWSYEEQNRTGDHIWYVSDLSKFQSHYPNWQLRYDVKAILREIYEVGVERWKPRAQAAILGAQVSRLSFASASQATSVERESAQATPSQGEPSLLRALPELSKTKKNVLGIGVDAVNYAEAVEQIIAAAKMKTSFSLSALAVHGVMTGVLDRAHSYRLNHFDLIVPDGQPVRWALNLLHKTELRDRVYGPNLMLRTCEQAAQEGLPIYLYGSTAETLDQLGHNLRERFPNLVIAGVQPSRFRQLSAEEKLEVAAQIKASGAAITFVGLGCPRQEVFVYEFRAALPMPLLAVGAAFDFHAGTVAQAPPFMQRNGLEWCYRLLHEPRRLWQRYVLLNPLYVTMLLLQAVGLKQFNLRDTTPPSQELRFG
ncbi:MAG: WecB/TagA/CpsF family glycosyltransferase [Blastocatellia bacterium]|nr:WecB/TagA/CpsF family glycosyltransferase [Blastocatellia bacterium]